MRCPDCGRHCEPDQRFCNGCGRSLADLHGDLTDDLDRTQLIAAGAEPSWSEPDWAPTGSLPTQPVEMATEPIQVATIAPSTVSGDAAATSVIDQHAPRTETMPAAPQPHRPRRGFRFSIVTVLGVAGAVLALAAMFTTIVSISSSVALLPDENMPNGFVVGDLIFGDLASNLPIAGLIAACCMAAGGVAAGFGWRWGAGLAAGGGLSFAGLATLAIGVAQIPLDAARQYARMPTEQAFTLSLTRDAGYWLLIVAAAFGIVLFFASLADAAADRRRDLNPWIAAVGALCSVGTVAGPLIPVQQAILSDNWYLIDGPGEAPAMLVVTRLIQLGLLGLCGVLGFLLVRRYGLGLAIGGSLPGIWLGVSLFGELGDTPIGPGWRNPGASRMELHGVTVIGLAGLVSLLLIAGVAAYNQSIDQH